MRLPFGLVLNRKTNLKSRLVICLSHLLFNILAGFYYLTDRVINFVPPHLKHKAAAII